MGFNLLADCTLQVEMIATYSLPWSDTVNQHHTQFSIILETGLHGLMQQICTRYNSALSLKMLWSDVANQHQIQFSIILENALVWCSKSAPGTFQHYPWKCPGLMQQISTRYNSALPWNCSGLMQQISTRYNSALSLKLPWCDPSNQHQIQFSIILKTALVWSPLSLTLIHPKLFLLDCNHILSSVHLSIYKH